MIGAIGGPKRSDRDVSCSCIPDLETWHVKALIDFPNDVSCLQFHVIRR